MGGHNRDAGTRGVDDRGTENRISRPTMILPFRPDRITHTQSANSNNGGINWLNNSPLNALELGNFVTWFNSHIYPNHIAILGRDHKLNRGPIHTRWTREGESVTPRANVIWIFERMDILTGKPLSEINLKEFIGHFVIIYKETGARFQGICERGSAAYMFENKGKKSYNMSPNRKAGNQLRDCGVIALPSDVEAWNSEVLYPSHYSQEIKLWANECDFYRYRGRGLSQITWRNSYEACVPPVLREMGVISAGGTSDSEIMDHYTTSQLDDLFLNSLEFSMRVYKKKNEPYYDIIERGDYRGFSVQINRGSSIHTSLEALCITIENAIQRDLRAWADKFHR